MYTSEYLSVHRLKARAGAFTHITGCVDRRSAGKPSDTLDTLDWREWVE